MVPDSDSAVHVILPRSLNSTSLNVKVELTSQSPTSTDVMLILESLVIFIFIPDEVTQLHVIMARGLENTEQQNTAESEVSLDSTELLYLTRVTSTGSTKNVGGTVIKKCILMIRVKSSALKHTKHCDGNIFRHHRDLWNVEVRLASVYTRVFNAN